MTKDIATNTAIPGVGYTSASTTALRNRIASAYQRQRTDQTVRC